MLSTRGMSMIGQRIKEIRNNNNLTQEELAEGIISRTYLSLIEKGTVQPSTNVLVKLSKRLNCTVNDFMTEVSHFKYNNFEILREIGHYELKVEHGDFESVKYFIDKEYEQIEDIPMPDSGRIHLIYAQYYRHLGDSKRTRTNIDKALKQLSTVAVNQHYINAVLLKADLLVNDKLTDQAIDILEDALYMLTKFDELNISDLKLRYALVKCYIIFKQYYTAHRIITDIELISTRLGIHYKDLEIEQLKVLCLVKIERYNDALEILTTTDDEVLLVLKAYSYFKMDKVKEADALFKQLANIELDTSVIPEITVVYRELTERLGGL